MSKNILIIGNGFDLYHKLPTSYKDFLFFTKHWNEFKEEYDKQKKPKYHKIINGLKFALETGTN